MIDNSMLQEIIELRAALREYRRLNNQGMRDVKEVYACHREADRLLAKDEANDNPDERWDAPFRIEHRAFIKRLFR